MSIFLKHFLTHFPKHFPCCVHIHLTPFPPFFLCLAASDMKKDIESLIAQEKEEIVAKYEKVPRRCSSPAGWLRLMLFIPLGMHQGGSFRLPAGIAPVTPCHRASCRLSLPAHPLPPHPGVPHGPSVHSAQVLKVPRFTPGWLMPSRPDFSDLQPFPAHGGGTGEAELVHFSLACVVLGSLEQVLVSWL